MIENLLGSFEKSLEKYGMDFVSDRHTLDKGLYMRISPEGQISTYIVQDSKEVALDEDYRWFQKRDFISRYVDSNKAIYTKPNKGRIHSNNYLTCFIKKDNIIESDKTAEKKNFLSQQDIIENLKSYFESLLGENLNMSRFLDSINYQLSKEHYDFCKHFLIDNYSKIEKVILEKADEFEWYIKIFFDFDYDLYQEESRRYLVHKVFNSNDYTLLMEDDTIGLTNFNMGLNAKKKYLEHQTKKSNVKKGNIPYALSLNDAINLYWYGLYLKNHSNKHYYQIMDDLLDIELSSESLKTMQPQNMIVLSANNGQKIITDYDIVPTFETRSSYKTKNYLEYTYMKDGIEVLKEYSNDKLGTIKAMELDINKYFFSNQLLYNYHTDPKDINGNNYMSNRQKNVLMLTRDLLFDYFYKGLYMDLQVFIDKYGIVFVKDRLFSFNNKNPFYEAIDAFNTYYSIKSFCKGGSKVENLQSIKNQVNKITESNGAELFETNDAYSYAAGQVAYYLLRQSESSKMNHDMVMPMLDKKKVSQLNRELVFTFKKYAHKISSKHIKFNQVYSAVLSYNESEKVNEEAFLAGYLSNNIFYMKNKEEKEHE